MFLGHHRADSRWTLSASKKPVIRLFSGIVKILGWMQIIAVFVHQLIGGSYFDICRKCFQQPWTKMDYSFYYRRSTDQEISKRLKEWSMEYMFLSFHVEECGHDN